MSLWMILKWILRNKGEKCSLDQKPGDIKNPSICTLFPSLIKS